MVRRTCLECEAGRIELCPETFELDRFLYDVEVDALHAWLRQLVAFDAYCAARDAGGPPEPPVR